jgi:hypothetical protein
MLRVMLAVFKLMGTAKERRVTILIALDAAPLTKTLSVFIVSTIISDPNDIDPKTGKTNKTEDNHDFFAEVFVFSFLSSLVQLESIRMFSI